MAMRKESASFCYRLICGTRLEGYNLSAVFFWFTLPIIELFLLTILHKNQLSKVFLYTSLFLQYIFILNDDCFISNTPKINKDMSKQGVTLINEKTLATLSAVSGNIKNQPVDSIRFMSSLVLVFKNL